MHIQKVLIKNYRCLRDSTVTLNPKLNILVGDNECGKSTFLEAINLALSGQLAGRPIQSELHPFLFNSDAVREYIASLKSGNGAIPPSILVELYFADDPQLAKLKGRINSLKEDLPGISLSIELNRDFLEEFEAYVASPDAIQTLPVEYYSARWRAFSDNDVVARTIPIKPSFIDASTIRTGAASRYVVDILKDGLTREQQVNLALSYRMMKDKFLKEDRIVGINGVLASKKGEVSDKVLSVSLDSSSRTGWESGVMAHLDEVPLSLVGKGEQTSIKIKLALDNSSESHVVLIEEPENHLSFSSLNELIGHMAKRNGHRQLIITTHSSFVLNKLGIDSVILFNRGKSARLHDLNRDTCDYFLKLPGHDTLRLILSKRAILVEGPSDELIVQRAFAMKHGHMPLEAGIDIISVRSLAFNRFIEIVALLDRTVDVVTDNDGDVSALERKYCRWHAYPSIKVHYDSDELADTLEPQLLKANGLAIVNQILGTSHVTDEDLLNYMKSSKTECALTFFETTIPWEVPEYIDRAIR